jgi:hypothetical protein
MAEESMDAKRGNLEFNSEIDPKQLTDANIRRISDVLARELATEAKLALEAGATSQGFHIRIGGGHSRSFSRTGEHKNVYHSRTIGGGSAEGPF